jgi:ubiquinone/menaquinone biosynthesis C-methylase UbiE
MTELALRPHVAPWWVGYLLISPMRRWAHDPHRILAPHVSAGQTVLEVGPGMGFFTLELAKLVGPHGRVVTVDCQERMLARLRERARRAGVGDRVDARICPEHTLQVADLSGAVDRILAFNVVHEAAEPARMIGEMAFALRPGGQLLFSEPLGHVSDDVFQRECDVFREAGLRVTARPHLWRQRTVVMEKVV